MSWHKIEIPDPMPGDNKMTIIQDELDSIWLALGSNKGVTLWCSKDKPFILYLSPEASVIGKESIKNYNGVACSQPLSSDVKFLLGHESDRIALP